MSSYPYRVNPQEPAVFVELYLPKKAVFQGLLYDALTSGFRLEAVKAHFLQADPLKQQQIRSLLGKSWTRVDYSPEEIESFRRVYFGYSLYDVNGVFLKGFPAATEAAGGDRDDDYRIVEETSQVVRMVFKYPCATEPTVALDFLMLALQRPLSEMSRFATVHQREIRATAGAEADRVFALLADLERWQMYVGLFVFGYLIYQICEGVLALSDAAVGQIAPADLLQDEIWVTSGWSMSMNVVNWVQRPPGSR